jgi:hypothetical protein
LFNLHFIVVGVQAGVQAQELELGAATVTGGRVQQVVVGGAQCQFGKVAVTYAPAVGFAPVTNIVVGGVQYPRPLVIT